MLSIVTCKWRDPGYRWNDLYQLTARHVNRLYRAVHENLRLPHEFVCLTDDPEGIDPGVRVLPVPMKYAELGMCWRRLWLFSDSARKVIGPRFVSMDLDCAVTGDLTPLFDRPEDSDRPEDFVVWRTGRSDPKNPHLYCGSMFMMTAGSCAQVWDTFDPIASPAAVKHMIGSDQAWFSHVLGPDMPTWGMAEGVYSYRFHFGGCGLPVRDRRMRLSREPRPGCRVVFFHGPFSPCMPSVQAAYPWIADYWNETERKAA